MNVESKEAKKDQRGGADILGGGRDGQDRRGGSSSDIGLDRERENFTKRSLLGSALNGSEMKSILKNSSCRKHDANRPPTNGSPSRSFTSLSLSPTHRPPTLPPNPTPQSNSPPTHSSDHFSRNYDVRLSFPSLSNSDQGRLHGSSGFSAVRGHRGKDGVEVSWLFTSIASTGGEEMLESGGAEQSC